MNIVKRKLLLFSIWISASYMLIALLVLYFFVNKPKVAPPVAYSIFASDPLISSEVSDSIASTDSRAQIIDQYFAKHKCPLTGTGLKMVELSDKYNFDFWWLPAIAWQESTCGKSSIPGAYNEWGYGIYGTTVTKFTSWDEAMDQVARDLKKNYFDKGLIEPCDVEKRYTPPSKGSWCKSIKYFRDEMLDFKTTTASKKI